MKVTRAEIEKTLTLLEQTPLRISATLMNAQKDVYFKPNPKAWSAHEILMHMRSCADTWGETIREMLEHNRPTLAEIHPNARLKQGHYKEEEFVMSLRVFIDGRERLLAVLKELRFEDWSRGAIIGGREHTVFSQARRIALHEDEHCGQIENLLGE